MKLRALITTVIVIGGATLLAAGGLIVWNVTSTPASPLAAPEPQSTVHSTARSARPTQTPASTPPAQITAEGEPTRVVVNTIGVDENLHGVGLKPDGAMDVPDFGSAAWYNLGPEPGEPGPGVIVAHVSGPQGPDVFARLDELQPGDVITVYRTDGVVNFVVTGSERTPKTALPVDRIWNDTDEAVLRLITCGGAFDTASGHFVDNVIVYAERAA